MFLTITVKAFSGVSRAQNFQKRTKKRPREMANKMQRILSVFLTSFQQGPGLLRSVPFFLGCHETNKVSDIFYMNSRCQMFIVSVITFLSPNSSHISWWLTFEGNHYSNALFSAISIFNIGLSGKSFPSLFPGRVLMVQRRLALTKGNQNNKFQGMSVLTTRWNLLF